MEEKSKLPEKELQSLNDLEELIDKVIPQVSRLEEYQIGYKMKEIRIVELSLYNCGLSSLPTSFRNLEDLEILDLSKNNFTQLPDAIFNLKELYCLDLRDNNLRDLPDIYNNLPHLSELYVEGNDIKELPESLLSNMEIYWFEIDDPSLRRIINRRVELDLMKQCYTSPINFDLTEIYPFFDNFDLMKILWYDKIEDHSEIFVSTFLNYITNEENFTKLSENSKKTLFQNLDIQRLTNSDEQFEIIDELLEILSKPHLQKYSYIKENKEKFVSYFLEDPFYYRTHYLISNGDKGMINQIKMRFLELLSDVTTQKRVIDFFMEFGHWDIVDNKVLKSLEIKKLTIYTRYYFPNQLGDIISLEELTIQTGEPHREYELKISKSICNLINLKSLNLSYAYRLASLPECIKNLKTLKRISLPQSEVFQVPDWLYELNWLEELNLILYFDADYLKVNFMDYFHHFENFEFVQFIGNLVHLRKSKIIRIMIKDLFIDLKEEYDEEKFLELKKIVCGKIIKLTSIKAHFEKITSIKFLSEKKFMTSSWDKTIKIWEINNNKINLIKELHHDRMVDMIYLTPDNRYIIAVGANSSTKVWEYDNFKLIMDIPSNDITSTEFILSRDKKFMAVPIIKNWRLYHNIYEIPNQVKIQTIETFFSAPQNCRYFFFLSNSTPNEFEITKGLASPDHTIFLRKERESVDIYACDSEKKFGSLESPKIRFFGKNPLYKYIFSQDSSLIACPHNYYESFRILIWDAKTLKILHNLRGHNDMINAIQFSNDKNYLISGSADKKLKIWDVKEGNLLHTLDGHSSYIESIAISNKKRFIISGAYDGELIVWKKI